MSGPTVPTPPSIPPPSGHRQPSWVTPIVAVFVVVVIVLGAYAAMGALRAPAPSKGGANVPRVLIPNGTIDSFPGGQFNAVAFVIENPSVVQGNFTTTFGIIVYTMTPGQFSVFVRDSNLSGGYTWASQVYSGETIDSVTVNVSAGHWDLVFDDPSPVQATMVGYLSNLTLAAAR